MGGGIGIPPMLETAKAIQGEKIIVSGYRDELFLTEELNAAGQLYLATEDGSAGTKGNVLDAVKANRLEADLIFACGPTPMLRAIKAYALDKGIPCWVSMEEKWPAESAHVLPVSANLQRWTDILRFIISGSARMVLYS